MIKLGTNQDKEKDDVMPFGKYRGIKFEELSNGYIQTLLEKCDFMKDSLRNKLAEVMENRKDELPCFKTLYDRGSRTCAKCIFIEECAKNCDCGEEYE